jgi:hypothetical protein
VDTKSPLTEGLELTQIRSLKRSSKDVRNN